MTDHSYRFRTANIQQLQQLHGLYAQTLRSLLLDRDDADALAFDEAIAAILSAPADTDEKPLPPVLHPIDPPVNPWPLPKRKAPFVVIGGRNHETEPEDPTIIHAAEDIVLEPGEYEDTSTLGRQFTILGRVPSVKHCGVWVFILMPDGAAQGITVTAVRRVESKAPQESSPAGSAGTCDGTNGAASGPVAQQPAQPAGESQPEGECASSVATTLNDWHRVNAERQHEAFAPPHPLMALVACVQEEVGELAGAVLGVTGEKKRKAHKTRDDVLDAVADAMTYLSLIATNQGCDDLEKLLGDVFNMVSERAGSKLRTGLGQPLKTTEVARVYKERAEKAEQESSLQRDRAKRAELRLEQAERECAELRSELELLKEAESSISRSFAAYRNEAMGRSDAASHAVKELTEKLATYEREAKAWEVIERYRESQGDADVVIHFQHNSASSPAIRIGAFSETGISRLAAWCESQLNKESE